MFAFTAIRTALLFLINSFFKSVMSVLAVAMTEKFFNALAEDVIVWTLTKIKDSTENTLDDKIVKALLVRLPNGVSREG